MSFLAAAQTGSSPIPIDTNDKRPMVRWAVYQEHIADHDELLKWQQWLESGRCGIGLVCGAVSGRLIAIDIEDGFRSRMPELAQRLRAAGLFEVFESWVAGYTESTPRGGLHVLVHVGGDGRVDGNTKLAMAADGHVLVETRGEGGYVVIAPSRNGTRGWEVVAGDLASIAWATAEEWAAVAAVLASFDESSRPPAPPLHPTSTPPILRLGGDWIDRELQSLPSVTEILAANGWTQARSADSYGQHWVRPDKDPREGHSASVNHDSGRLWVHSTSAGLPVGVSMDALDLSFALEAGRMPTLDERVEALRQRRPLARAAGDAAGQAAVTSPADSSLNLPDAFWQSADHPFLDHIRIAALARRLSPDAVWEAVKCFYAAAIPWNHRLPDDGTMDYISIVVGASGAGKSRAKSEAYNLLERLWTLDGVRFPVPPGSGEGMTEVFLDRSKDATSKYALRGVGFYADEGKWLLDISSRPGNTTLQALKQLWSGELTGSVAATADRHRWLAPRDVRATMLISATPDVAAQFLRSDLSDEGLPQRISWGWAHYPHEQARPAHPGPLSVQAWRQLPDLYAIELDPALAEMIDAERLAASRGELDRTHEGHATYAKLKTAAILAHLAGRMDVTMSDWELSVLDWSTTRTIRATLLATQAKAAEDRNISLGQARAHQRIAESDVYLEKAVHSLVTKLKNAKSPLTKRQIKDHLRKFSRAYNVDHHEVIHRAVQRGLAVDDGSGHVSA